MATVLSRTSAPRGNWRLLVALLGGAWGILVALPAHPAGRSQTPLLPEIPFNYALPALPAHAAALSSLANATSNMTDAGATLGRVLFHDRQLSANGLVACASCHAQRAGFDDPTRFSIGFQGRITRRSAMALANARYNPRGRYFRDERAASLEQQTLQPFFDPIEMGLAPGELGQRVASRDYYGPLFAAAFGDPEPSEDRIASALAQFVRSLVSFGSRYDAARANAPAALTDFASFSPAENRGKFLFLTDRDKGGAGCAGCHQTDAFLMLAPRDNGLAARPGKPDGGVGELTGKPEDRGRFRAPSLRNIAVSAPYMRDGRFASLEKVLAHYSDGIEATPNLDKALRDAAGNPSPLRLPDADKNALIAFLETLTDETFLGDAKFSDPFRTD